MKNGKMKKDKFEQMKKDFATHENDEKRRRAWR
jgi:hypothetical protein